MSALIVTVTDHIRGIGRGSIGLKSTITLRAEVGLLLVILIRIPIKAPPGEPLGAQG